MNKSINIRRLGFRRSLIMISTPIILNDMIEGLDFLDIENALKYMKNTFNMEAIL